MSSVKKLAGQTLWYGIPTIAKRFLGYILNMALPFLFARPAVTADLTQVYAIITFLNVLFTYGVETSYFRFSSEKDRAKLYNTLSLSILLTTIVFTIVLYFLKPAIVTVADLDDHPEYITIMLGILFFDTLSTLPFARLRQENRPKKYAFVQVAGIVLNMLIVLFFLGVFPAYAKNHPNGFLATFYNEKIGIGYYLIGGLCGSILTYLLLWKEWKEIHFDFDFKLWKEVMHYSYPLIIVGLGGMVNDMLSRLVYQHVVDLPKEEAKHQLGVFANIYRIAVLITIMIQAFRMAAEPFFFSQSKNEDAPRTYARIMKFFVIASCFMFLFIGLYLDVLKWIITVKSDAWGEGMNVVLLLAMGNIFLGIYYNLSIWYKLTNKNLYGAAITIGGAVITIFINMLLIPGFHYWGAALATFICYLFMMITSYVLGQKFFPVPYPKKKLIAYLVLVSLIVVFHRIIVYFYPPLWFSVVSGTVLLALFTYFVSRVERKELQKMPIINRWVK